MGNTEKWIEHLQHPLVLVGFALFIVAKLVCWLKPEKLSGAAIERLFGRGLSYVFILSIIIIVAGIYISLPITAYQPNNQKSFIIQKTNGDKSPAINSSRDVNIYYGAIPKLNDKQLATKSQAISSSTKVSPTVKQITKGDKSPTINSQGGVNINYEQ